MHYIKINYIYIFYYSCLYRFSINQNVCDHFHLKTLERDLTLSIDVETHVGLFHLE